MNICEAQFYLSIRGQIVIVIYSYIVIYLPWTMTMVTSFVLFCIFNKRRLNRFVMDLICMFHDNSYQANYASKINIHA